jgi:hypothetical protein
MARAALLAALALAACGVPARAACDGAWCGRALLQVGRRQWTLWGRCRAPPRPGRGLAGVGGRAPQSASSTTASFLQALGAPSTALPPAPKGNNADRLSPVVARMAVPPVAAAAGSTPVALRTAADGSACRLPVVASGSLVVNCTIIAGVPDSCLVAGDPLPRACGPPTGDALPLATALASGSAGDGARGALCALVAGAAGVLPCKKGLKCVELAGEMRLAGTDYGYCKSNTTAAGAVVANATTAAPTKLVAVPTANRAAPSKAATLSVTPRRTVSGAPCRLPMFYGGVLLTACTDLGAGSSPACFARGVMGAETCAPAAADATPMTVADMLARSPPGDRGFGALCRVPAGVNATTADCLPGYLCAPMPTGPLANSTVIGFCAGGGVAPGGRPAAFAVATAGPAGMLVARSRKTTTGAYCRLPLYVDGRLLADCTADGNSTGCFVGSALKRRGVCAATQDDWASVPLASMLEAGVAGDGGLGALCALPGGRWPVGRACEAGDGYVCAPATAGPFNGSTSVGVCAKSGGTGAAAVAAAPAAIKTVSPADPVARAALADGSLPVPRRRTVTGTPCRLPIVLATGKLMTDCRPVAGFASDACYTKGLVAAAPCAPANATSPPRTFASLLEAGGGGDGQAGSICSVFGGVYSGAMPAAACGPGLRCLPFAGDYGSCGAAAVPAAAVRLRGSTNGTGTPTATPTPTSASSVDVARRAAVTGLPCRLPVRVAGDLVTDCTTLQGGEGRCFVDGNLTITHPCAPASPNTPPLPLASLEGDGRLSDGRRGGLCHVQAPGAAANGVAPPLVKCKAGLDCVPFVGPPLAGSRFGWCKLAGGGAVVAPVAAPAVVAAAPAAAATLAPPAMTPLPPSRNSTVRTPFWGAPVYDRAANVGSSYYCGASCVFGSVSAMVLTVAALTGVCVLACRRGGGGGGQEAGGPPAGAFTTSQPPPATPSPPRAPAAGGGIALSLRPTRYERFEDAPESGVAAPAPAAANPFAAAPAPAPAAAYPPQAGQWR